MQVGYSCSPPYVVPDPNADVIFPLNDSLGSPNRSHRESYFDMVMTVIVTCIIALGAVLVLGTVFGSF